MQPTVLTIAKTVAKSIGDLGLGPSGPCRCGWGLLCFAVGYGASGLGGGRTVVRPVQDARWWSRAAGSLEVVW